MEGDFTMPRERQCTQHTKRVLSSVQTRRQLHCCVHASIFSINASPHKLDRTVAHLSSCCASST
eukprot:4952441-Pleurochrysis_carterae.AAC.1